MAKNALLARIWRIYLMARTARVFLDITMRARTLDHQVDTR